MTPEAADEGTGLARNAAGHPVAVAWLEFKMAGFLIHLLLIVGIIMLVLGLVKRGRRPVSRDI